MNRKQFIESQGATCRNWQWSWSFINEKEKTIIFGVWDTHTDDLIFSESWQVDSNGTKRKGYKQSREHIQLIEEKGYQLKTFPMKRSDKNDDAPSKIKDFEPTLSSKSLTKVRGKWYAVENELGGALPEEVVSPEQYFEGASKTVSVNTYERSAEARTKCIKHHGCACAVCSFSFKTFYGAIGENYIHVHHVVPLSEIKKEYVLDPVKDLIPVCPNCHAIIHKTQPALTIEQLRQHLISNEQNT